MYVAKRCTWPKTGLRSQVIGEEAELWMVILNREMLGSRYKGTHPHTPTVIQVSLQTVQEQEACVSVRTHTH